MQFSLVFPGDRKVANKVSYFETLSCEAGGKRK